MVTYMYMYFGYILNLPEATFQEEVKNVSVGDRVLLEDEADLQS